MGSSQPLSLLRIDSLGVDLAIQLVRRFANVAGTSALDYELAKGGLAAWQLKRVSDHLKADLSADLV